MTQKEAQRNRIVHALRLTYASLESHLDYSVQAVEPMCESCGTRKFHADTVKEYAYVIHVLADLL